MRLRVLAGAVERQDQLRIEAQALGGDGIPEPGSDVDVIETAHDAKIVRLIHLYPIAATILGGLTSGFGGGERMHQLPRFGVERRHADADGNVNARLTMHLAELLRAFAQRFRKLRTVIK